MDKSIMLIIAVSIVSILMWILLPTFTTFIKSADLQNVVIQTNTSTVLNATGGYDHYHNTFVDVGWAGTLFTTIYAVAAACIPLGLIGYLGYKHFKK